MLVVDDNATNREILGVQLGSWALRLAEAADGPSALRQLYGALEEGAPFALAILDFQMPGMDGITLGRVIRADPRFKDTVLVLMTPWANRRKPPG